VADDDAGPWSSDLRRGYCYHSALLGYKTETLLRKWRDGPSPHRQKAIAYELSFREPALALAEVKAVIDARRGRLTAALRTCLHHVADGATARARGASDGFDPDALHVGAFATLVEDYLAALPELDRATAEVRLRTLGFLAGPYPRPLWDGPTGSPENRTSRDRYAALLLRLLAAGFECPALAHVRPELAEHLRCTLEPAAYRYLLSRWERGELPAAAVFAAFWRLGWAEVDAGLGGRALDLVGAFVAELAGPPSPFEAAALHHASLPFSVRGLPPAAARAVTLAFLDQPRLAAQHDAAAVMLLEVSPDGAADLLARAPSLPTAVVATAAAHLPYPEARRRLLRAGMDADHPALTDHPGAPPPPLDLTLGPRGAALYASDPAGGCELLVRAARDPRHPHRDAAFATLVDLARDGRDPRARRYALHALGRVGDPRAAPTLREALADPTLSGARLLVLSALADVGDAMPSTDV
jgi:hypothetical protein